MYWSIFIKLVLGMIGVLLFLRLTGKTHMANLTPPGYCKYHCSRRISW